MDEAKEIKNLYGMMQMIVYAVVCIEIIMFVSFPFLSRIEVVLSRVAAIPIYSNIFYSKLFILGVIIITSIGTKAKKNINFDPVKHITVPLFVGLILFFGSIIFLNIRNSPLVTEWQNIAYIATSFCGAMLINVALDNISKQIKSGFMKDRFNIENESFAQTREKVETEYSVNIPMQFHYKNRHHDGWINIVNPFRGTLLIGTPGSGKSFTVVNSYIRQHAAKKFAMVVYDFKYPDLAKVTYYQYLKNKKKGLIPNYQFNVVNFDNVEYSKRINPIKREYIEVLADATETSEALCESLQKGERGSGSSKFFDQSAINFLAACIYFFARHEGGKYSTLAHVLAFINLPYKKIFDTLFSNIELQSLLSPFKTAYDNKAFDQLEGQIGSLKVQISRLATKEAFWVFTGDDFDLKVSDPKNPSYLIIANNPKTQSMNSALNALIINRLTRLVNTKGNIPTSIIVDEAPTLYFHQIANLLSTARSNKVSVLLGLQEIPQLEEQYGKNIAKTITSVIGNVISASARCKETLEWLQTLFGKVKQIKEGVSITKSQTTVTINEQMDFLIPASKIASLPAGSIVGQIALDFGIGEEIENTTFNCATKLNLEAIKKEEDNFVELPKYYNFGGDEQKERKLQKNFMKVYAEVDEVVNFYE
jgi:hypothetical protein